MNKYFTAGVSALATSLIFATAPAMASTVGLSLETTATYNETLDVFGATEAERLYETVKIKIQDEAINVYAGAFQVTETGTSNDWLAFCIDLFQSYGVPATFNIGSDLVTDMAIDRLDKLFTNYFDDVTTDTNAAAFQVAIWEIVTDGDLKLARGDFKFGSRGGNAGAHAAASGFLAGLDGLTGGGFELTFLQNDKVQDLVIADPSPVPLPAGGLLLLAGLGAMGAMRRKAK